MAISDSMLSDDATILPYLWLCGRLQGGNRLLLLYLGRQLRVDGGHLRRDGGDGGDEGLAPRHEVPGKQVMGAM